MRISDRRVCWAAAALCVSSSAVARSSPGNFTGFRRDGNTVTVFAAEASVRISLYAPDVLRVDYLPSTTGVTDSSFAVIRAPAPGLRFTLRETDSALTLSSSSLQVRCRKYPLRLSFADSSGGELLAESLSGGMSAQGEGIAERFLIRPGEHFYGTGERGTGLDLRGRAFDCYNTQVGGYATAPATMNLSVSFIVSTGGYAVYFDNAYRSRFDVGATDSTAMVYTGAGRGLTYYYIAAPSLVRALERYTWLTGRPPLPPRWAFGFIQSKNRYRTEGEARSVVQTMRGKGFPCDAIVLDLQWFRSMGDFRWDSSAWRDPGLMMSDFLGAGIKTVLITEPYIVSTSVNYAEALRLGYVARDSVGRPYILGGWWSCGGCDAALLDITNPAAAAWWWSKYPAFMGKEAAGLWTDLGEPERHPLGMVHVQGSADKVHNVYNLLWARTIFAGMGRFRPGERVFNLTRSGSAGIQRYGVIPWSGDVSRTFTGLAAQIPILLNMGLSGLPYENSDIGGYARNPTTPELYIRWMEFGVFSPVARAHGAGEMVHGSPTEPWRFGEEAETICRDMLRLRYRLLPYIYGMAHQAYETGLPLARPLIMMYPGDPRFTNECSSYLWGDDFLVAPVLRAGETSRQVNFPAGDWVNFWTDEIVHGGESREVPAPLARIPLFVKSGSIIPMAPAMEYSDQRPLDTLTLCVYPAPGAGSSSVLYEDDGKTTAYQSGRFSATRFSQKLVPVGDSCRLDIVLGKSEGEYAGKIRNRVYAVEIHAVKSEPGSVTANGNLLPALTRAPGEGRSGDGYRFDGRLSCLTVYVRSGADSSSIVSISGIRVP